MRTTAWAVVLIGLLPGCQERIDPTPADAPAAAPAPAVTGSIRGQVRWSGSIPEVAPWVAERWRPSANKADVIERPNVLRPQVDAASGGVAGAVVFLRHAPAGAWTLPVVAGVLHDAEPLFQQGPGERRNVAVIPVGGRVRFTSAQALPHAVRARGAAFFTLALPERHDVRERTFPEAGLVELSSAANHFWMRGFLWVAPHPYFAVTDAHGGYTLSSVPTGTYELVCWHPHWESARQERDAETTVVARMTLKPPLERHASVEVDGKSDVTHDFTLSNGAFTERR